MVPSGTVVLAATPIGNVGDASDRLKALLADATSSRPRTRGDCMTSRTDSACT